ncbi:MAG: lipoprotein signal peptidase [Bacteroidetes bacterium]|nr:lipoprotein signal peptidase [Bacteroidota bacterium]
MKARKIFFIVLLIIVADQALKIWVKTHMPLSHSWDVYYHNPVTPYDNGIKIFGNKFQIYFVENEGMAWGWKFGGGLGKMALTLFRLAAVIFGVFYIRSIIQKKYHKGFIICAALIFAGALGNLIDSMFYGLIFEESTFDHVAKFFPAKGYASFLHGRVVDMLYFPLVRTHYPQWMPFVGGDDFEFFSPVFNIADASISVGVIAILFFQKRFFKKLPENQHITVETNSTVDDKVQVL